MVKSRDSDRVACGDDARRCDGFVEEDEGEHAVKQVAEVLVMFFVLWGEYR